MQRRLRMLPTVVLLMTIMSTLTVSPASAIAFTKPKDPASPERDGTPLPAIVCDTTVASPLIGWRGGQCWVFHEASTSFF